MNKEFEELPDEVMEGVLGGIGQEDAEAAFKDTILNRYRSDFASSFQRNRRITDMLKENVDTLLQGNPGITRNI